MPIARGFDNSNATVEAVAAPGAGKKVVYTAIRVNVLEADSVIVKSGTDEVDRFILPANGMANERYNGEYEWMECGENKALNLTKTANTDMAYRIVYGIRTV